MELRNVLTFLRIAELENFTHAANELGYSQSTATVHVKQLEQELGFLLFDRIGKKVSLTPKGEQFLKYANSLAAISEKIKTITEQDMPYKGLLRIGCIESLFTNEVLPIITQYIKKYPLVRIKTKIASGEELLEMLHRNELDIVLIIGKKKVHPLLAKVYDRPSESIFIAGKNFATHSSSPLTLADITQMPLLLTEAKSIYRKELENAASEHNIELNPIIEVDNTIALKELVKSGLGVSFLPEYTVRNELANGDIIPIQAKDFQVVLWKQLFYHKNKWVTPPMQVFFDMIMEAQYT